MPEGYTINDRAVAQLLYGKVPTADIIPIYPELRRRAEAVERRAKLLAGKRTGHLARSIHLTDYRVPGGWHFRITAHAPYALLHHRGTKPHKIIGPVGFRASGRKIVVSEVDHPGTKPNPFLANALHAFLGLRDIPSLVR